MWWRGGGRQWQQHQSNQDAPCHNHHETIAQTCRQKQTKLLIKHINARKHTSILCLRASLDTSDRQSSPPEGTTVLEWESFSGPLFKDPTYWRKLFGMGKFFKTLVKRMSLGKRLRSMDLPKSISWREEGNSLNISSTDFAAWLSKGVHGTYWKISILIYQTLATENY